VGVHLHLVFCNVPDALLEVILELLRFKAVPCAFKRDVKGARAVARATSDVVEAEEDPPLVAVVDQLIHGEDVLIREP
jgi:hypothetical protein